MRRLALLLLVIALVSSACGNGSAASADLVPADFATRAIAACQHAHDLKVAQGPFPFPTFNPTKPDPSLLPAVAIVLGKTAATFGTWLTDLKALGTPATGQAAWADLLAGVERHVNLNADQIDAANRGDGSKFAADYAEGLKAQTAVLAAATAAGVGACAQVDR